MSAKIKEPSRDLEEGDLLADSNYEVALEEVRMDQLMADETTTPEAKLAYIGEFLRRYADQPFIASRLRTILIDRALLPPESDASEEDHEAQNSSA